MQQSGKRGSTTPGSQANGPTANGSSTKGASGKSAPPSGPARLDGARFENTFDPRLGVEELEGWFPRLPPDQPGVALVVQRENQRLQVVWPMGGGSADPGPFHGRPRRVHKVDVSDHPMQLRCDLPSKGDGHRFEAMLHFTCVVRRPEEVVLHSIKDVGATLGPLLEDAMRQVSRRYQIGDSANAEQAVRVELQRREDDQGFHPAFALRRMSLRVDLDSTGRWQAEEVRQEDHKARLATATAARNVERADTYRTLVGEGDWGMLRLALAQDPRLLPQVLQAMRNGDDARFQNGFQALRFLVQERVIGPEDIPQHVRDVLGINVTRLLGKPKKLGQPQTPEPDEDDD